MDRPRLPTVAERAELAKLLAKRHPCYPFLTTVEMVQLVVKVYRSAISVIDGDAASPKLLFVLWNGEQTAAESFAWSNGQLEPAPTWCQTLLAALV